MIIKNLYWLMLLALIINSCINDPADMQKKESGKAKVKAAKFALVIHGGAGNISRENLDPKKEEEIRKKLKEALELGYGILENGGSSLDAVESSIQILEESPYFNAGKGAVFTHEGKNELDASIMYGKNGAAGAVAGVSTIKSPIAAARAVMENSAHVLLTGRGAELFAEQQGLQIVDPAYFRVEERLEDLQKILKSEKESKDSLSETEKFGTVGCVALDMEGNLAAGTSTGGMSNKKYGRIGDSPIIGAGTFAENASCAVSATGHGEYFIRNVVAYDIAALMKYKNLSVEEASHVVIMKKLVEKGGDGGVISMDAKGNISIQFNTPGMYRGYMKEGEEAVVKIFKEE